MENLSDLRPPLHRGPSKICRKESPERSFLAGMEGIRRLHKHRQPAKPRKTRSKSRGVGQPDMWGGNRGVPLAGPLHNTLRGMDITHS